jgi:hypothetical protein
MINNENQPFFKSLRNSRRLSLLKAKVKENDPSLVDKRAYIQQAKVGFVDISSNNLSSLGNIEYLATSGVAACVATAIFLSADRTKILFAHFDSDQTNDMESYINSFLEYVPCEKETKISLIPSESSDKNLLEAIKNAVIKSYKKYEMAFDKPWPTEDICIKISTGEIKRYEEKNEDVGSSKKRDVLKIPETVKIFH